MSQRIFNSCKKIFADPIDNREEYERAVQEVRDNRQLLDKIRTEANLELVDVEAAHSFTIEKVLHMRCF